MNPFLRFLAAARSLANQGMSKEAIEQFAKNEFGKINTMMQKQINNIFKPSKPVGKKDEVFDSTVEKMQFDDAGKPFNPRNPTKDYSKKAEGGIMRVGLKDGFPSREENLRLLKEELKEIFKKQTDPFPKPGGKKFKNFTLGLENILSKSRPKNADGGRIGLKEGRIARILKSLKPFGSENKFSNQLEGILYGEMGLAEGLNLLSQSGLFAEGGRIGYKDGPDKPGRRKFMKMAAGIASLIPGIGMIGKGAKVAAPVVAKAAEITGPALAKLVDTVMSAGKLISLTGTRVKNMVTKKKLGKVEVEEDIADGSYIIKKDGKEIYYKPGRMDESGIEDDIIEVIEDRVKKAGGGIGYMLGE